MRPLCFGLWFIKLIKILRIALPCTYCPLPPFDICLWPKSISKQKHKTDRGSGPPVPNWPAGCKRTLGHSSRRHHRHWKRNGSLCRGWKLRPKNFTNNTKTQRKVWFDNAMLTIIGFLFTANEWDVLCLLAYMSKAKRYVWILNERFFNSHNYIYVFLWAWTSTMMRWIH